MCLSHQDDVDGGDTFSLTKAQVMEIDVLATYKLSVSTCPPSRL